MVSNSDIDGSAVLAHLLDPECDAQSLAGVLGLSLDDVAEAMESPSVRRGVRGVIALYEMRARVLLSQLRFNALIGRHAANEDGGESVRKACVDLLTLSLSSQPSDQSDGSEVWSTDTSSAMHELLERLGSGSA